MTSLQQETNNNKQKQTNNAKLFTIFTKQGSLIGLVGLVTPITWHSSHGIWTCAFLPQFSLDMCPSSLVPDFFFCQMREP